MAFLGQKQPLVVAGRTPQAYIQTLMNGGLNPWPRKVDLLPRALCSVFQWPDLLRYFAKGLWGRVWYPDDPNNPGLNPIPDALIGVGDFSMELCTATSLESGLRALRYQYGDKLSALEDNFDVVVVIPVFYASPTLFSLSFPNKTRLLGIACVVDWRDDCGPVKVAVDSELLEKKESYTVPVYSLITRTDIKNCPDLKCVG